MAMAKPSVYEALGVRSFINASNNATVFGGSVMPAEVVEAMAQASSEFVELAGLHAAAGRKIAETVGSRGSARLQRRLQRLYVGGSVLYYGKRFGGRSTSA